MKQYGEPEDLMPATVTGGRIACPHCGSGTVKYGIVLLEEHRILEIEGKTIYYSGDAQDADDEFTEFTSYLVCQDCRRESGKPAGYNFGMRA